ncbi:MAG: sigma-70 family RNA polymerase sigma factor [Phycisphaerae bacterium]|nr:sigma-70 family RNA polymerase sigma factor [Phycisphaerae bacterium]MDD5380132.1 sigma-70 family RNA polymerase sigma factor [Phycisphaerae bacterium]
MERVKTESVPPANVARAAEIFSKYEDFIRTVICYHVKNDAQADDLLQDFFLSLVSKPIPANIHNVKGYLYKAITNDIVDAVRRVEKYKTRMGKYAECFNYSVNNNEPENALIEIEQTNEMFRLIKGCLRYSEAQAITLRYKNSYNIEEAAKKMNVNNRTISRYISTGLNKVRQFLIVKQGDLE